MATRTHEAPSVLLSMHKRYEQACAEYEITSAAAQEAREVDDRRFIRLEIGHRDATSEADALRVAILYQVPRDLAEAAILQFHIGTMHDMIDNCEGRQGHEEDALKTAIQTLFDFLACEMSGDHEETAGPAFRDEAVRVYFARRYRTGEVGE